MNGCSQISGHFTTCPTALWSQVPLGGLRGSWQECGLVMWNRSGETLTSPFSDFVFKSSLMRPKPEQNRGRRLNPSSENLNTITIQWKMPNNDEMARHWTLAGAPLENSSPLQGVCYNYTETLLHGLSYVLISLYTTSTHWNKTLRWFKILNMYIQEPCHTPSQLSCFKIFGVQCVFRKLPSLWNDIDLDLPTVFLELSLEIKSQSKWGLKGLSQKTRNTYCIWISCISHNPFWWKSYIIIRIFPLYIVQLIYEVRS